MSIHIILEGNAHHGPKRANRKSIIRMFIDPLKKRLAEYLEFFKTKLLALPEKPLYLIGRHLASAVAAERRGAVVFGRGEAGDALPESGELEHHETVEFVRAFHDPLATTARRSHAADGGIGPRINRKEKALSRKCSLSCLSVTPTSTVTSRPSGVDLQVVLIAKPLTEVLRLLAVHIAQTDFTKLPISK